MAHDGAWLALSIGACWLLSRLVGRKIPHWISWAAWTSSIVIALWLPLARGYGDRLDNDTILPRNYTASVLILLPTIWAAAAVWGAIGVRRSRQDSVTAGNDVGPS